MKKFLSILLVLFVALGSRAESFSIHHIPIHAEDEAGATKAREKALAEGQRQAFDVLMDQIVVSRDREEAKEIEEGQLLNFIQDVSLDHEKTSSTKYMGVLSVRFVPERIEKFLKDKNISFMRRLPPRFLLVPIVENTENIFENNPFYDRLKENPPVSSLYVFSQPLGDAEDLLSITFENMVSQNKKMTDILSKYDSDQILLVALRSDGEKFLMTTQTYPPSDDMIFSVVSEGRYFPSPAEMDDMMTQLIFKMEEKWKLRYFSSSEMPSVFSFSVPVSSLQEWTQMEKKLKKLSFIEKTDVFSFKKNKVSIRLFFKGSEEELREKLRQKGYTVLQTGSEVLLISSRTTMPSLESISLGGI